MKVQSFVPSGSGAWVLHDQLRGALPDYQLRQYSRWWELLPWAMPLLRNQGADLIHATLDYGALFRSAGQPLVTTAHNYVLDEGMQAYASAFQRLHYRTDLRWLTLQGLLYSERVVAVSQFVADCLRHDLGFEGQVDVIYNGIDTARFVPAIKKTTSRRFRVLFCGNTTRRKRAELLIPLANALGKRFEIHYTSGLSGSKALQGERSLNSAELVPLGRVPYVNMPDVYQQVDLLFMPSAREGFGLCVAEAMGCGLPVVAAKGSAIDELVKQEQGGLMCPVDDVECFADAIRRIADSPSAKALMGQFNRDRVETLFSLPGMVDAYRNLFARLLDSTTSR